MSRLLYLVACLLDGTRDADGHRRPGQRRPRPDPDRRPGPLSHHRQAAPPRHRRRPRRAGRRRRRASPLLALRARGTLLPERAAERRRDVPAPAVPLARDRRRHRQSSPPWTAGSSPSTGSAAGSARCIRDPVAVIVVFALSIVSARSTSAATRPAAGTAARGPAASARASTSSGRRSSPTSPTPTGSAAAGRLRTDLGGLYFNLIIILALAGVYAATRRRVLLLVIAVTHLEMLEQLLPFVRFDGYFMLSRPDRRPRPVRPRRRPSSKGP